LLHFLTRLMAPPPTPPTTSPMTLTLPTLLTPPTAPALLPAAFVRVPPRGAQSRPR
jgi:hypothetical protein